MHYVITPRCGRKSDFNLAVSSSSQTTKPANLIPPSNFPAIRPLSALLRPLYCGRSPLLRSVAATRVSPHYCGRLPLCCAWPWCVGVRLCSDNVPQRSRPPYNTDTVPTNAEQLRSGETKFTSIYVAVTSSIEYP